MGYANDTITCVIINIEEKKMIEIRKKLNESGPILLRFETLLNIFLDGFNEYSLSMDGWSKLLVTSANQLEGRILELAELLGFDGYVMNNNETGEGIKLRFEDGRVKQEAVV